MTKEEFKCLRQQLSLTQLQLAELLHKTDRQIQNYELGKTPIPYIVAILMKQMTNSYQGEIQ